MLTHAHEDHCGLAKRVRDEAKDAEILVQAGRGPPFGRLHRSRTELAAAFRVSDKVFEE